MSALHAKPNSAMFAALFTLYGLKPFFIFKIINVTKSNSNRVFNYLEFDSIMYDHYTCDLSASYTLVIIHSGVFGSSTRFPFADSPFHRVCALQTKHKKTRLLKMSLYPNGHVFINILFGHDEYIFIF